MPRGGPGSAPEAPARPAAAGRRRFTRRHRLTRAREFQRVFDRPYRSRGGGLTVLARPNGLSLPRLGLVISARCARRAVDRHRLKRLVRESFRLHQDRLRGLDVVVIGKPGLAQRPNREVFAALEEHWRRLERWAPS